MKQSLRFIRLLTLVFALFSLTPIYRSAAGQIRPDSPLRFGPVVPLPLRSEPRVEAEPLFTPLALASADFDEDGVADLISAYRVGTAGALRWQRGNVDTMFPHSPGAQARKASGKFSSAPFYPATGLVELPEAPEFIGAGDFDADGHGDLVTAARGSRQLQYLRGDGHGNFRAASLLALPGAVTALAVGEINHADGLTDVFVGITGNEQAQLLIFTGEQGALNARPESITLPQPAQEIVAGQLDENFSGDLAVAAGNILITVSGKLADEVSYRLQSEDWGVPIAALAVGDFAGNARAELAVLTQRGVVHKADRSEWL